MGEATMTRNIRALAVAGAVLAAVGVAGAGAQAVGAPAAQKAGAETQRIASTVLGHDRKITLTAVRSTDDPYAASVRMRLFAYRDGAWTETDRATVGEAGGWFWYPLTGPQAVCAFSAASSEPAPVSVSLLITPSIGCSPTAHYRIEDGQIISQ
jgi:hypothetical protein